MARRTLGSREQATNYLLKNDIFDSMDIGTPAIEFYIKSLTENTEDIFDIDCYAHLNTLCGYDIGFDRAMIITTWLYDPDMNERGIEFDTMELTIDDKEIVQECDKEMDLDLSFDKWRTEDFGCYEYY